MFCIQVLQGISEAGWKTIKRKKIKAGNRAKKLWLTDGMNPDWNDLYDEMY
nr:hypothetical protein [Maribellus maritimus]